MKVQQYYSDDYAGLETNSVDFYYGYEETKNDEWAFIAKDKEGKLLLKLSETEIKEKCDNRQLNMPQDFLLAGVGLYSDGLIMEEDEIQFIDMLNKLPKDKIIEYIHEYWIGLKSEANRILQHETYMAEETGNILKTQANKMRNILTTKVKNY